MCILHNTRSSRDRDSPPVGRINNDTKDETLSHELTALNNPHIIIPSFQRLPGQVKQTNSSLTSKSEERRPWCPEWVRIARPMLARRVSSLRFVYMLFEPTSSVSD